MSDASGDGQRNVRRGGALGLLLPASILVVAAVVAAWGFRFNTLSVAPKSGDNITQMPERDAVDQVTTDGLTYDNGIVRRTRGGTVSPTVGDNVTGSGGGTAPQQEEAAPPPCPT